MTTMWKSARLGQVPLVLGPSSPFYGYTPGGTFANPSGSPLMTEELTSPEPGREFHCYKAPDGSYVSVPFAQADAYKAAGYEAVDYSNCGAPPLHAQPVGGGSFMMGRKMAQSVTPPSPAPTAVSPGTIALGAGLLALGTWVGWAWKSKKTIYLVLDIGSVALISTGLYLGAKGLGVKV